MSYGFNKGNSVALEYLKEKYPGEKFLYKKSPTFVSTDKAFEVKRLYNTKIIINQKQKEMLEKTDPIILLVEANTIVDSFKWSEIETRPYEVVLNKIPENISMIRIPENVKARLLRYGKPNETPINIINRMLDVVESEIKEDNY